MDEWKLSFYKDMSFTRYEINMCIDDLKRGNDKMALDRLEFIQHNLNEFLSSYDDFITKERLKHLD